MLDNVICDNFLCNDFLRIMIQYLFNQYACITTKRGPLCSFCFKLLRIKKVFLSKNVIADQKLLFYFISSKV